MLKVGVIGIGQCGSRQAQEFKRIHSAVDPNIVALALNSSKTDLSLLDESLIPSKHRIAIADGGSGRNPGVGRKLMQKALDSAIEYVRRDLGSSEIIYIFAGAGGGTGNGGAPILGGAISEALHIPVVYMVTLPFDGDSLEAKICSLSMLQTLEQMNASVFLFSNKRGFEIGDAGSSALPVTYNKINKVIVGLLSEWTACVGSAGYPVFDESESLKMLAIPGFHVIARAAVSAGKEDYTAALAEEFVLSAKSGLSIANAENSIALGVHIFGACTGMFSRHVAELVHPGEERNWFPSYISMHGLPIVDLGDEEEESAASAPGKSAPGKKGSAKGKSAGDSKDKKASKDSKKKSDGVFHARAIGIIAGGELPDEVLSDSESAAEEMDKIKARKTRDILTNIVSSLNLGTINSRLMSGGKPQAGFTDPFETLRNSGISRSEISSAATESAEDKEPTAEQEQERDPDSAVLKKSRTSDIFPVV